VPSLDGVPVAFKKITLRDTRLEMLPETGSTLLRVPIALQVLLFRPRADQFVDALVHKLAPDHVNFRVCGVFPLVVPATAFGDVLRPAAEGQSLQSWRDVNGDDVAIGDRYRVFVSRVEPTSGSVALHGTLAVDGAKLVKKFVAPVVPVFTLPEPADVDVAESATSFASPKFSGFAKPAARKAASSSAATAADEFATQQIDAPTTPADSSENFFAQQARQATIFAAVVDDNNKEEKKAKKKEKKDKEKKEKKEKKDKEKKDEKKKSKKRSHDVVSTADATTATAADNINDDFDTADDDNDNDDDSAKSASSKKAKKPRLEKTAAAATSRK
jgi:hypothetical protein